MTDRRSELMLGDVLLGDARIVTPDGVIDRGWLAATEGRIAAVGAGDAPEGAESLGGDWVLPGFIDLHVHGGGGAAFTEGATAARTVVDAHRSGGTTSMLASVSSASIERLAAQCRDLVPVCESGDIVGIHLEGPFLSAAHRGAHDVRALREPDLGALNVILDAAQGWIRTVTLAPESAGADEMIAHLDDRGVVVAFGHTSASVAEMAAALSGRQGYITHLFNGMPLIHHRAPGGAVAALMDPNCVVEIINDGFHVHPDMVRWVFSQARDRVLLVTDAMAAAGLGDGDFVLQGSTIEVRDGRAWSPGAHSLAGSSITMTDAVRRAVQIGIPITEASAAGSQLPAQVLGIDGDVGSIQIGRRADLVVLGADLHLERVYRAGRLVG
ncbi:MAG: N-acetylglucosamine-6-phosphate deacetylase [Microbacterium sp.]